ncbi:ImmA/IrrE family metallo-endopeptidase [Peribacillus butanolivorans]|uniref:ImmA/IrrE family metallo-endopeptidase n=1 Tax=Peribacillus butanolivorans TaxID=421767 RepID=UPI0036CC1497
MKYHSSLLEDWIKNFYYSLDIYHPHQLDFLDIAARLGMVITFKNITSRYFEQDIIIDERLTSQEQWQEFAHELCHILRHEGNQIYMPKPFLELQENQANYFAYHFCIPTFMFLKLDMPNHRNQAIYYLANTFNVTNKFAAQRFDRYQNQIYTSQLIAENSKMYTY